MTIDSLTMTPALIYHRCRKMEEHTLAHKEIHLLGCSSEIETVQITEKIVNPNGERVSPHDFQLLKVLGKGGYGKVSPCNHSRSK